MSKIIKIIISVTITHAGLVLATPPPLEHFTKPAEIQDVVISPNGKYLAVQRAAEEGKTLVAIISTDELKLVSHIPAEKIRSPINPAWVTNERIVVELTENYRGRDYESYTGDLLAMDADGDNKRALVQSRAIGRTSDGLMFQVSDGGTRVPKNNLNGVAHIVHLLPKEKDYILISYRPYTLTGLDPEVELRRLKIGAGQSRRITVAPSLYADFTFTPNGTPKYSIGYDKDKISKGNYFVVHEYSEDEWKPLGGIDLSADVIEVLSLTDSETDIIIKARFKDSTDKLYRYNLATKEKQLLFYHPKVDPHSFDYDQKTGRLVSGHFEWTTPDIFLADPKHVYSLWYPALLNVFPNKKIRIASATEDGDKIIVHVTGANEPGQFHLFDTRTKKLRYLFKVRPWLDADKLAPTVAYSFKNRDGVELQGYLTLPLSTAKPSPLVVLPHGGPHGVRDLWNYDEEVQLLASRGYAVLQVNYRGSGGFGRGFQQSGYRKWGSEIQFDIIDATRWATAREEIDNNRVCIMGSSFGGYAALMSAIIEPDLYKCAISFAGLYDLELMWTTADIQTRQSGENYLDDAIGKDKKELNQFSPLNRLEALKAPVLLVHGQKDWRVDVKHFKHMVNALEKRNHPHESILIEKEGHGLGDEENRLQYYESVVAFLEKHL